MLDFNSFLENLRHLAQDIPSKKFLLAVSGGADSMVLSHLFCKAGLAFQVAHVNYHFRGEDSVLDQKTVEEFCDKNNLKFHVKSISDEEKSEMKSLQNWAREIRYAFFFNILKEEGIDYIVTAHHLNDDLETFFIHLSRGSGIKGLSGIPKNENQILRPLLSFSKQDIYDFAKQEHIAYREDLSNQKNDYLRNKIRNQLTPKILEIFPQFLNQFRESISHLNTVNTYYQEEIQKEFRRIITSENSEGYILNKKKLLDLPQPIATEIIRKLGFTGIEIGKILTAENGKLFRSSTYEISIKKHEILCHKRK